MSGMTSNMLRTRRKDVNVKPNRRLDRKSSRGMLYENEELRLRTININAEVERGQSDIKKLKRENEQLKREIMALRYEYDRLDQMLREGKSSPDHSDDSASVCSICPECTSVDAGSTRTQVAFNELSMVPEEEAPEIMSGSMKPCPCEECTPPKSDDDHEQDKPIRPDDIINTKTKDVTEIKPNKENNKIVDVIVHDTVAHDPQFFETIASEPTYRHNELATYQVPRFTGGNIEGFLADVTPMMSSPYLQNSLFMCNTRKVTHQTCNCEDRRKNFVTEKNIELTYDYPRTNPKPSTTTEVSSTVIYLEKRAPEKSNKFDFFFRSKSAPVGENEEPLYATVNKLPKRLRKIELANLEQEVAYKPEADSSRTEIKTDSEQSRIAAADDEHSPSEREKSLPKRIETPKARKRKRFSLTFKKRDRKRREIKDIGVNGLSEGDKLIETKDAKQKLCSRHRARNTVSSSSSGTKVKRDSYQEITTSHSEPERTNSVCSSVNSSASAYTHKSRKLSAPPSDSIPWCGCWGAGCL